jgi:hypothetical protein
MVLLHEASPYGSREAVVEDDGRTVYLYLVPANATEPGPDTQTVWVANRCPAPDEDDLVSMNEGNAPLMPLWGTRHPSARFPKAIPAPDLRGLVDFSGDAVTYLCVVPITTVEQQFAQQQGSQTLLREFTRKKRGWVWRAKT